MSEQARKLRLMIDKLTRFSIDATELENIAVHLEDTEAELARTIESSSARRGKLRGAKVRRVYGESLGALYRVTYGTNYSGSVVSGALNYFLTTAIKNFAADLCVSLGVDPGSMSVVSGGTLSSVQARVPEGTRPFRQVVEPDDAVEPEPEPTQLDPWWREGTSSLEAVAAMLGRRMASSMEQSLASELLPPASAIDAANDEATDSEGQSNRHSPPAPPPCDCLACVQARRRFDEIATSNAIWRRT